MLEPLSSLTVREGEGVVLSTHIVGNPKPTIVWLKNGKPVPDLPVVSRDDIYSLTLPETLKHHSGEYTVKAKNPIGSAETSASLNVEGNQN